VNVYDESLIAKKWTKMLYVVPTLTAVMDTHVAPITVVCDSFLLLLIALEYLGVQFILPKH